MLVKFWAVRLIHRVIVAWCSALNKPSSHGIIGTTIAEFVKYASCCGLIFWIRKRHTTKPVKIYTPQKFLCAQYRQYDTYFLSNLCIHQTDSWMKDLKVHLIASFVLLCYFYASWFWLRCVIVCNRIYEKESLNAQLHVCKNIILKRYTI